MGKYSTQGEKQSLIPKRASESHPFRTLFAPFSTSLIIPHPFFLQSVRSGEMWGRRRRCSVRVRRPRDDARRDNCVSGSGAVCESVTL